MAEVLLPVLLGVLGVAVGGAVLGGFLIWLFVGRWTQDIEPADVFDGYDREETVELRIEIPPPPSVVATRPMSAMERLEGPTVPIVFEIEPPWWYGGRHRALESRCRIPAFLDAPQGTLELPHVSVWPTGEYGVLGGAR